ncbi:hypothetical protein C8Q80DRAFT_1203405 [Daedaleopsis nitida]|nr:hypothetical protein C8Q80DRAFT_1203405 [Daedaleopsis nitida]
MYPSPVMMTLPECEDSRGEEVYERHTEAAICMSAPIATSPPEDPNAIKRDTMFYSDHIVFQIGNRLFKVPRRKFEDSEIFNDMFALPAGNDALAVDGSSDEKPLVLETIEVAEFRALLRVMFRPHHAPTYEESKELTLEEWISVLKLTTMWRFEKLRRVAIDSLTPLLQLEDPVRWISLARKYDVHEWLFPSLHALARRTKAQQLGEVADLGIATVVKMAEVRESYVGNYNNNFQRNTFSRSQHNFEAEIRRLFKEELKVTDQYGYGC